MTDAWRIGDVIVNGTRNWVPVDPHGNGYDQGYQGYGTDQQVKPESTLNDAISFDTTSTNSLLECLAAASRSSLTPSALAALSTWVYRFQSSGPNSTTTVPQGFTRLNSDSVQSNASGFFGVALRQDATGDIIFIARGSQEAIDFYDDLDLADLGILGSDASDFAQFDDMQRLIDNVINGQTPIGTDIYFAGHSLGGALAAAGVAQIISAWGESRFSVSGTTFGTLPIGNVLNDRGMGSNGAGQHITNYMGEFDPARLSHALGEAPGNTVILPMPLSSLLNNLADNHAITRYIGETPNNPWEIDIGRDDIPYADPVFIDLDGDGVSLVSHRDSNVEFDFDGDGMADRTTWVDQGDGVLFLDLGNDGLITSRNEIAFATLAGAQSDLAALALLDANYDGLFSADDYAFTAFKIWSDLNGDGRSSVDEVMTLEQAGVVSIDIRLNHDRFAIDGGRVHNTTIVSFTDGHTSSAWDVDLETVDIQPRHLEDFA